MIALMAYCTLIYQRSPRAPDPATGHVASVDWLGGEPRYATAAEATWFAPMHLLVAAWFVTAVIIQLVELAAARRGRPGR